MQVCWDNVGAGRRLIRLMRMGLFSGPARDGEQARVETAANGANRRRSSPGRSTTSRPATSSPSRSTSRISRRSLSWARPAWNRAGSRRSQSTRSVERRPLIPDEQCCAVLARRLDSLGLLSAHEPRPVDGRLVAGGLESSQLRLDLRCLRRIPTGDSGGDDDQYSCNQDRHDPSHPVNS